MTHENNPEVKPKRSHKSHVKGIGSDSLLGPGGSKPIPIPSYRTGRRIAIEVEDAKLLLKCAMTCQASLNNSLNRNKGMGGDIHLVPILENKHNRVLDLIQRVAHQLDHIGCGLRNGDTFI